MDRRLVINFVKTVGENLYHFALPVNVSWAEALGVIKEFADTAYQMAQDEDARQAALLAAQESPTSETSEEVTGEVTNTPAQDVPQGS